MRFLFGCGPQWSLMNFSPIYLLYGALYFVRHLQSVSRPAIQAFTSSAITSALILVPWSLFTFALQRRILTVILSHIPIIGSLASVSLLGIRMTTYFTLSLLSIEAALLSTYILVNKTREATATHLFDAVLRDQHVIVGPLVQDGQVKRPLPQVEINQRIVSLAKSKISKRVLSSLLTFPLNFIPVLGQVIYCITNGRARQSAIHERYFDKKGMSQEDRARWIKDRETDYLVFGIVEQALEIVPFVGMILGFCNTCGAALWAADMERNQEVARRQLGVNWTEEDAHQYESKLAIDQDDKTK